MNLVTGTMLKPNQAPDPDNHQFGTITLIIADLLGRGMRPHPTKIAEKIEASERDVWKTFPVVFTHRDKIA
jgi:hypothetical protein